MKRKRSIITLFLIMTISLILGLIGCSQKEVTEFDAKFKSGLPSEVYFSVEIDLDDYVEKVDGTMFDVTVEYYDLIAGNVKSEVFFGNNMVFFPKNVGEHTITYRVSSLSGKVSKTAKMKLSVIADPPTISISHTAQTITFPDKYNGVRTFDALMDNASMTLSPVNATTKVVGASFRGVNVGLDSVEMTWVKVELDADAEKFTFNEIGEYQFFVEASSEGNTAQAYFLVNVINDPSAGTKTDSDTQIVKTGKGVVYSEDNPYTFKLMSSFISDINYAVIDTPLTDTTNKNDDGQIKGGEKVNLVFKGKNAPQLGFYVKRDDGVPTNPYNIKTTSGGFFSFVAKESSGHSWVYFFPNMLIGDACRTPIPDQNDFGLEDFDDNKYYLMQYSLSTYDYREEYGLRLKVNVEISEVLSYYADENTSQCVVGEKLCEIGDFGIYYFNDNGKDGFDFTGETVIYGDIRNNIDIQYIPSETDILPAPKQEKLVEGSNNVYSYNSSVSLNADNSITATLNKGEISDSQGKGVTDTLGYMGITNSGFGIGTTIALDFVGKNLPGIALYLDNSPTGYAIGGATASGTGFYLGNGNVSNIHNVATLGGRYMVNGPYRLDPGGEYRGNVNYPPYYDNIGELSYLGTKDDDYKNKNAEMGYNWLEDGKKYRFELSDVSEKDVNQQFTKFALKYVLYDMSGATPLELISVTKTVDRSYKTANQNSFDEINFNSQTIAFFSSIYEDVTFTYSISGERIEYVVPVVPEPETYDNTLNCATGITHSNLGNTGTYDYKGLGSYKVGDVLEFYFTGKNIPNVALFANKNGVNCIGGEGENTGIFIQTSGYNATFNQRLYFTGPFLLDAGSPTPYEPLNIDNFTYSQEICKNKDIEVQTNSPFAIDNLTEGTKYVYRIETAESQTTNYVVIKVYLYSVNGEGVRSEISNYTFDRPHFLQTFGGLENTYAIVYGAGSQHGKTIWFNYAINPQD